MSKVTKLCIDFKRVQFTICQLYVNKAAFKNLHYSETADQKEIKSFFLNLKSSQRKDRFNIKE